MVTRVPAPKINFQFPVFTQQETSGHKVQTKLQSENQPFHIQTLVTKNIKEFFCLFKHHWTKVPSNNQWLHINCCIKIKFAGRIWLNISVSDFKTSGSTHWSFNNTQRFCKILLVNNQPKPNIYIFAQLHKTILFQLFTWRKQELNLKTTGLTGCDGYTGSSSKDDFISTVIHTAGNTTTLSPNQTLLRKPAS